MMEVLNQIIQDFQVRPMVAGRQMRQLLESDRNVFFESSLNHLRAATDNPGSLYLLTLLSRNGMILDPLSDPTLFSLEEAVNLARMLIRIEPLLGQFLAETHRSGGDLSEAHSRADSENGAGSAKGIRLVEILDAISDGARILPVMAQLLNHPDGWVRSKAALMVGRNSRNHKWVEQRLSEPDARVRANALESLWGVDSEGSRTVFWGALSDPDNRVAGNALLGLYHLGEAGSVSLALNMLKHSAEDFRLTAIWLMGETGDQRFLSVLARFLVDANAKVRTAAFRAVARLRQRGTGYLAGPKLELHARGMEDSDNWVQVCVEVWLNGDPGAPSKDICGLKATQFVLHENSLLVSQYQIEELSHPEPTAIAFGVPQVLEASDPVHESCERAFTQAIRHKRKLDSWMVLKYLSEKASESPPADAVSLPPEARFSTDPAAIMQAVQTAGQRTTLPSGLAKAARGLLPAVMQARSARHLVLFQHPLGGGGSGDAESADWTELTRQARVGRVAVHCLGPSETPETKELCSKETKELCSKTGGSYWPVSSIDEIPAVLEALCASLINGYRIRYRSPSLDPAPSSSLKVQVYASQGFGQVTFVRPA